MRADILIFAAYPTAALAVGGALAIWRTPGPQLRSAIQHLAAGVLFAALATELLPDLLHRRLPLTTVAGFSAGVAAMLAVKHFAERFGQRGLAAGPNSTSLVIILGIDILLDGLLIGLGFAAGQKQGMLLTIALSLVVFFLAMAGAAALKGADASRGKIGSIMLFFSALIMAGAAIGTIVLANASDTVLNAILSFGLASLLYLVTEELLVEAHEVPETPAQASMFFVGFVLLMVIEMRISS